MKKIFIIIVVFIVIISIVQAKDLRVVKLKKFLDQYPWSPLRGHEEEIIKYADEFDIDYRLYLAIAGAESSFGKNYPRWSHNLTGYGIYGDQIYRFKSISHNIYETSKLVGTSDHYAKYRETKDLNDFVYVYKGVPPFTQHISNMRFILDRIHATSIEEERLAWLALLKSPEYQKKIKMDLLKRNIDLWTKARFDLYQTEATSTFDFKLAAK